MAQRSYTKEEIRHWKSLIYGTDIGNKGAEDWVSSVASPGRTKKKKVPSSKRGTSSSSPQNEDWLSPAQEPPGSGGRTKRSYREKGIKSKIGNPNLY